MKQALAAAVSLSLALVPAGTRAASRSGGLTDVFIHLCGNTKGDADRALQLADAEEWSVPRKGLTVPTFGDVEWVRRQGRWTQSEGVRRVLMVGTIRDPDGKDELYCTVGEIVPPGFKADVAAMKGSLQDWVGGSPLRVQPAFVEFAYREAHGLRMTILPPEDPLAEGAPRSPPDVARVTLNYSLTMVTISYARSL